jgi:hypothetical protein
MFKTVMWLFAIYICVECFIQFYKMDRGDKLCRLAKYFFSVCVGFAGVILTQLTQYVPFIWFWIIPDIAIALFLWPTTYARATGSFKNRIGD